MWFLAAAVVSAGAATWGAAWRPVQGVAFRAGVVGAGLVLALARLSQLDDAVVRGGAIVGGAFLLLAGPRVFEARAPGKPRTWGLVGLGLLVMVLVRVVVDGGALGHDEAAIALKARAWAEGTPDTGWSVHRGIGASLLAVPVVLFTDSAAALRAVAVVGTIATVLAVWYLSRVVGSRRSALIAAAVYAVGFSFIRRGAEFLTDVPSTGLLVLATAFLWRWLTDQGASDSVLFASVASGVVAVYIRYQSVLTLGLLVVVAVILFRPRIRHSAGTVMRAVLLGLGLALPLLVWSTATAGVPWGPFLSAAEAGGRAFVGEGLVDYAEAFPYLLAGPLGAGAIVVALGWLLIRLRTGHSPGGADPRLPVFLVLPALAQIAVLGLLSHGEPRFVFYPVALLVVAASVTVDEMRRTASPVVRRAFVASLAVALIVGLAEAGARADRQAEDRAEGFAALVAAAEVAASEAKACALMTGHVPQVTWITRCASFSFGLDSVRIPDEVRSGGAMLIFDDGIRQPSGRLLEEYVEEAGTEAILVDGSGDGVADGQVYVFSR